MIARLLASLGAVAAAVGLVIFGMGTAFVEPDDSLIHLGIILMVGGVIAAVIGGLIYRASLNASTAAANRTNPQG
jgi:multisubunit Na+/H+ antiporter MnhG subunit